MTLAPRVVVVHRRTEREQIVREQGTWERAKYQAKMLKSVRALSAVADRYDAAESALQTVSSAIPSAWRRGAVEREDLDRFLFEPEDLVVVVGQDGLVANVAKYLDGQPVIGIDADPGSGMGVLTRHRAQECALLLQATADRRAQTQERTMVEAAVDGQVGLGLTALNEIYLGSPTHQSARYTLSTMDGARERHSSSGVVIGTGTGATGWCSSIARERATAPPSPAPDEAALCWFVREAWPSPGTGVALTSGRLGPGERVELSSEGERLVAFADGLEADRLDLAWGQRISIGVADRRLRLIT